jgi:hypothetical protein
MEACTTSPAPEIDPLVTALGQVLGVVAALDDDDEVRRVFASVAALRDMALCDCDDEEG